MYPVLRGTTAKALNLHLGDVGSRGHTFLARHESVSYVFILVVPSNIRGDGILGQDYFILVLD